MTFSLIDEVIINQNKTHIGSPLKMTGEVHLIITNGEIKLTVIAYGSDKLHCHLERSERKS